MFIYLFIYLFVLLYIYLYIYIFSYLSAILFVYVFIYLYFKVDRGGLGEIEDKCGRNQKKIKEEIRRGKRVGERLTGERGREQRGTRGRHIGKVRGEKRLQ